MISLRFHRKSRRLISNRDLTGIHNAGDHSRANCIKKSPTKEGLAVKDLQIDSPFFVTYRRFVARKPDQRLSSANAPVNEADLPIVLHLKTKNLVLLEIRCQSMAEEGLEPSHRLPDTGF